MDPGDVETVCSRSCFGDVVELKVVAVSMWVPNLLLGHDDLLLGHDDLLLGHGDLLQDGDLLQVHGDLLQVHGDFQVHGDRFQVYGDLLLLNAKDPCSSVSHGQYFSETWQFQIDAFAGCHRVSKSRDQKDVLQVGISQMGDPLAVYRSYW